MERIPGDADARRKVMILCVVNVLAKWRSRGPAIESGRTSLNVLRVDDHAVAEVSGSGATVSCAGNDWRIGSLPKTRVEIRKESIAIIRSSEVGVAHAETQRQV